MRIVLVIFIALNFISNVRAIDPPPAAMKLIEEFKAKEKAAKEKLEAEIAALRAKAVKETEAAKKLLVADLQKIRAALEAEEKHNEARAVAARIRSITAPPIHAAIAPQNMSAYAGNPANIDKSFVFRLTGRLEGSTVWGVGPYTSDSDLYRAAVHAGVVSKGETGFIKVTLISTVGSDFAGNTQNGVTTTSYTEYATGYRLERVTTEEAEGIIEAEDPVPSAVEPGSESPSSAGANGVLSPGSGAPAVKRLSPRSTLRPAIKK